MEFSDMATKYAHVKDVFKDLELVRHRMQGLKDMIKNVEDMETLLFLYLEPQCCGSYQIRGNDFLLSHIKPIVIQDLTNRLKETEQEYKKLCATFETFNL